MLFLLYSTIVSAISVSRIWDSALVVFSTTLSRLLIVCSSLFWTAPSEDLWAETLEIASAIESIAYVAFAPVLSTRFNPLTPSPAESIVSTVKEILLFSSASAPTWRPIWSPCVTSLFPSSIVKEIWVFVELYAPLFTWSADLILASYPASAPIELALISSFLINSYALFAEITDASLSPTPSAVFPPVVSSVIATYVCVPTITLAPSFTSALISSFLRMFSVRSTLVPLSSATVYSVPLTVILSPAFAPWIAVLTSAIVEPIV